MSPGSEPRRVLNSQSFSTTGFIVVEGLIDSALCDRLGAELDSSTSGRAGSRTLLSNSSCRKLAEALKRRSDIVSLLPSDAVAVQCTLFDKNASRNWLVPFHQDLSIPVRQRSECAGWSAWSFKEGQWFVQPPNAVLESLLAIRIHLDPSTPENGSLRVVPGSHRFGRLGDAEADQVRLRSSEVGVYTERGGALIMSPLLLHASSRASQPTARRVLQFLFGPRQLPDGFQWADAV